LDPEEPNQRGSGFETLAAGSPDVAGAIAGTVPCIPAVTVTVSYVLSVAAIPLLQASLLLYLDSLAVVAGFPNIAFPTLLLLLELLQVLLTSLLSGVSFVPYIFSVADLPALLYVASLLLFPFLSSLAFVSPACVNVAGVPALTASL
jgi:hypothetical protein